MSFRQERILVALLIVVAFGLRGGLLWVRGEQLSQDRDAYRAIAQGLVDGHGFANAETGKPTAYRPPLYPLILAGLFKLRADNILVGCLHLFVGVATVLLTLGIGRRLGLGKVAIIPASLVAVDPLLLQYTTFSMTETVFTFLLTLLIAFATKSIANTRQLSNTQKSTASTALSPQIAAESFHWHRQLLIGTVFGLCALCRPTVLVAGMLTMLWWIVSGFRQANTGQRWRTIPWTIVLMTIVVISPWLIRNLNVFGKPIVATTHGGYTLLLGNNRVFYHEVVAKPWGTVWDDATDERSQQAWYSKLKETMAVELGEDATEPDHDRWMYGRAWQNISDEPSLFARACLLRFLRFWNVVPSGPARSSIPSLLVWGIGIFYGLVTAGMLLGLLKLSRAEWFVWMPLVLTIAGFCLVHLFFWTNMRMRAPLVPAIALLAARGFAALTPGPDKP